MSRRARRWWHGVEAEAEGRSDDAPGPAAADAGVGATERDREPWADRADRALAAALTADQRALLAGLDDQPDQPHLDGLVTAADQPAVPRLRAGNGTGNAPGEAATARPYRRTRWTEPEQER